MVLATYEPISRGFNNCLFTGKRLLIDNFNQFCSSRPPPSPLDHPGHGAFIKSAIGKKKGARLIT